MHTRLYLANLTCLANYNVSAGLQLILADWSSKNTARNVNRVLNMSSRKSGIGKEDINENDWKCIWLSVIHLHYLTQTTTTTTDISKTNCEISSGASSKISEIYLKNLANQNGMRGLLMPLMTTWQVEHRLHQNRIKKFTRLSWHLRKFHKSQMSAVNRNVNHLAQWAKTLIANGGWI